MKTIIKVMFAAFVLLMVPTTQVVAQKSVEEMDEIAAALGEKYEVVEYCPTQELFCVMQDDEWEFCDEQGTVLTEMHISHVERAWDYLTITVGGQQYKVEKPIENNRLLVNRYDRCAYMDMKGKLLTAFVYGTLGGEIYNAEESAELIRVNAAVESFLADTKYTTPAPVDGLLAVLTPENVNLLSDEFIETVMGRLYLHVINSPDQNDKAKIEALFDAVYCNENCSGNIVKLIAAYRYRTVTDDTVKFQLMKGVAERINDAETYTICGNMLRNGTGCEQNIPQAIYYYERAALDDGRDRYAENARQALRELWQSDSTRYENPYGRLLSRYEDFRVFQDYVFVRNGGYTGVCDETFTEILPCRYKTVKCLMPPLYAVEDYDGGVQLVTTGGKELTAPDYDDMLIMQYQDSTFIVFAEKDYKWGMIDREGKPVTPMVFDNVSMPFFSFGEVYPTITKDGEDFQLYRPYKSERAIVRKDGRYGLMDTDGSIVVPFQYTYIEPFAEGDTTTQATTENDTTTTIKLK